jgi:hypothetical protein
MSLGASEFILLYMLETLNDSMYPGVKWIIGLLKNKVSRKAFKSPIYIFSPGAQTVSRTEGMGVRGGYGV